MSKIQVITDTDSNFPIDLARQLGVTLVPITIQFGEESFADSFDIQNHELFERIDRMNKLPTTAAPSIGAFSKAYREAFENGAESIICITVGSRISRTYESALSATEEFQGKKITVIDSEYLSMGQAFMAITAVEAIAAGASHEEAVEKAKSLIPRFVLYGSLSTLKYLALGGRLSNLAASMANMLNIRPILCMRDGKLDLLEKVRTRKVAMDRLVELVVKAVDGKPIERACIIHVLNVEDAEILKSRLSAELNMPADFPLVEFGPGLSVHGGAGLVGVVILKSE